MRKIIIAGNWKLNKTSLDAVTFVNILKRHFNTESEVDIVVCPAYTALTAVGEILHDSPIELGAQDVYWEDSGAFTGEVSAPMLKELGVKYVIIGHSERRQYFGETNQTVLKKTKAALKYGLIPIVCMGENLYERESNKTFDVIKKQCEEGLSGFSTDEFKTIVVAYEPVWAIGTGKTASPTQAQEVHKFIRGLLAKMYDEQLASQTRIQYGGSVKPDNTAELMSQPDIDGALVGGASLQEDSFVNIIKNSCNLKK